MTKYLVWTMLLGTGMVAGMTISSVQAQDTATGGVQRISRIKEEFKMPVGVRADGNPKPESEVKYGRNLVYVPQHYGDVHYVTGHGRDAVFWYLGSDGELRNAIIKDAADQLFRIDRVPTSRLNIDYR